MNNFRLLIQYDGGRYKGWQRLGSGEATVQGKLEDVLSRLTGEQTEVFGSSRTDAGVHALSQIANFKTAKDLTEAEVNAYLNDYLPQDICVKQVAAVPEDFHARYHAKGKVYLYRIWNQAHPNPFLRKYSMHVKQRLDIASMKVAASHLIGRHDFTAFSNAKSGKKSMVREIYSIEIEEGEGLVQIRVAGNGFLYNMVRKMVGTLIAVGLGQETAQDVPRTLAEKQRSRAGHMADACGLFLERVSYESGTKQTEEPIG